MGSCYRRRRPQHTRPHGVVRSNTSLLVHRLDREHRQASVGRPNRSRVPPRIPRSRCWYRRHRPDNTRTAGTRCPPPPRVHMYGADCIRSTERGPVVSPPVHHLFPGLLQSKIGSAAPSFAVHHIWFQVRQYGLCTPVIIGLSSLNGPCRADRWA